MIFFVALQMLYLLVESLVSDFIALHPQKFMNAQFML